MAAILDKLPDVHVGRLDVTSVVRETVREVSDDDVPGLAAEMAYHSILALFPFLLFLAGLTAVINRFFDVGNLTDRIVDRASDSTIGRTLKKTFSSPTADSNGSFRRRQTARS